LIYIIHENDAWMDTLRAALTSLRLPYKEWFVGFGGVVDFSEPPPHGIFFNRISPSSHTRGHRWAVEQTQQILTWLEMYDRRVVNGLSSLALEISKVRQYQLLVRHGIPVPHSIALTGTPKETGYVENAIEVVQRHFPSGEFIVKHNRGGSGHGVILIRSIDEFQRYLTSESFNLPLDGVLLLQQYIPCVSNIITRLEFVNSKFLYAVRVDTSNGFHLCPADLCVADGQNCPGDNHSKSKGKFQIEDIYLNDGLVIKLERMLKESEVEIAGIEVIEGEDGVTYVFDMNSNTNYNKVAELAAFGGLKGSLFVAKFLGNLLKDHYPEIPSPPRSPSMSRSPDILNYVM